MRDGFQIWVDAVCEQVRFRPDRKAIARELRVHYEDHYQDLLRLNCAPELAEQRALSAMGNAQEVGWALDRVHKPWLGWLWEGSRVLLLAVAAVLIWTLGQGGYGVRNVIQVTRDQLAWTAPPSGASHAAAGCADLWLAPGEVLQEDGRIQASLTLWMETRDVCHSEYLGIWEYLEAAADGEAVPPWRSGDQEGDVYFSCRSGTENTLAGWTRFRIEIVLTLDSPPRRVEITCPWADWTLTAEWEAEP